MELRDRVAGVILGGAVGDALGLPMEGLSRRRAARIFPGPPRHRLLPGRGMCSDDTEHACMTAAALLRHPHDPDAFARALAWKLRWWLLGLPAGVGLATLRAIARLWLGIPPARSGVHSAGNGPAMRAAVIGAFFRDDEPLLREYLRASTRITHTDPRAERGALLIALAAAHAVRGFEVGSFIEIALRESVDDPELHAHLTLAARQLQVGGSALAFADAIGLSRGVSGYINHTVPVALFCWLRHPRGYGDAIADAIALGGDTDTVAALVGALVGATAGDAAIPREWLDRLIEYPRSVAWMRRLATALVDRPTPPPAPPGPPPAGPAFIPLLLARNIAFASIVLAHGLRRLLPPY